MIRTLYGSTAAAEIEADQQPMPRWPVLIIAALVLWAVGGIGIAALQAVCGG